MLDLKYEILLCGCIGSGFPKSMNIGLAIDKKTGVESKVVGIKEHCKKDFKENNLYAQDEANKNNTKCFGYGTEIVREAQNEWQGWGTALKPSFEPIIVARKPFKGSLVDNVIEYGVGGINIDECRVGNEEIKTQGGNNFSNLYGNYNEVIESSHNGRFPANTILTYDETDFDEVCGGFPYTKSGKNGIRQSDGFNKNDYGKGIGIKVGMNNGEYGDSGSASRYFYCAKASKKDRDEGLEEFEQQKVNDGRKKDADNAFQRGATLRHNIHPTVKPTELMQYLIRLVTPKGGTILDPFMGSGSTGKAAMFENKERQADYKFIGIEREKEYCNIAESRIKWANKYKEEQKNIDNKQISFDEL